MPLRPRPARPDDAEAIARIYNQGIEDRLATFETRLRSAADVAGWLAEGFPLIVVEEDGAAVAWASAPPYRPGREAYAGIGAPVLELRLGRVPGRRVARPRLLEARQPDLPGERSEPGPLPEPRLP